jgi:DeoR/GlpR family transcriptional regulator of sugar metabolism
MDLNPDEVRIKQEMADACERIFGILDGTKWHRSALLSFVPVDELTGIVTDASAPSDDVEAWRAAGVEVVVADPGPPEPPPLRPRDLRRAVRNTEELS